MAVLASWQKAPMLAGTNLNARGGKLALRVLHVETIRSYSGKISSWETKGLISSLGILSCGFGPTFFQIRQQPCSSICRAISNLPWKDS